MSFPLLSVITALTMCPVFITHCALLLVTTTQAQKAFLCRIWRYFTYTKAC